MPQVFIPAPMRKLTDGQTVVRIPGATLREVIDNLEARYPGTRERLIEEDDLLPGMAAVIDSEASIQGLSEKLHEDAEVHFLPAIAGGAC